MEICLRKPGKLTGVRGKIVPRGRVVLTEISVFQFAPVDRRIYRLIRMKMAYEDEVEDEGKRLSAEKPSAVDGYGKIQIRIRNYGGEG